MSTSALIGLEASDGTSQATDVHGDGYGHGEGVGSKLLAHWKRRDKVQRLLRLGFLSCLGSDCGTKHSFYGAESNHETTAYHRDRGDNMREPLKFRNRSDYFGACTGIQGASFLYLRCRGNDGWLVARNGQPARNLMDAAREPREAL